MSGRPSPTFLLADRLAEQPNGGFTLLGLLANVYGWTVELTATEDGTEVIRVTHPMLETIERHGTVAQHAADIYREAMTAQVDGPLQ